MSSSCRVCGERSRLTTLPLREGMFETHEEFTYEECAVCRSLQIQAIPPDLGRYYPPGYYAYREEAAQGWIRRLGRYPGRFRTRLLLEGGNLSYRLLRLLPFDLFGAQLHPLGPLRGKLTSRALGIADIGGGRGQLLTKLRDLGFTDLTCVDPFLSSPNLPGGITFVRQELRSLTRKFDLIMYHHTLEHVVDISTELRSIKDRLMPHGIALLRLPLLPNAAFDRYGRHWIQLDPPRHLHIPGRRGVEIAAARAGLEVVGTGDDSTEFQFWGSELYSRGVGLHRVDEAGGAKAFFSAAQLRRYRREAMALNARRRGDQGWFILKKSRAPASAEPVSSEQ
jgi:SAM-dependent methyltransferase